MTRKNDAKFEEKHEEFGKFLPEHLKRAQAQGLYFDGIHISKVENE